MLPTCLLCESTESELVEEGIRKDPAGKVYECKGCGLVYLWPQPTEEELTKYYSGQYRKDSQPVEQRFAWNWWEACRRAEMVSLMGNHVLEIGSGSGAFLKKMVAGVVGIEPDENSRRWIAKKIGVPVYKSIADLPEGSKFDLIVMFHVLEHLRDPVSFLQDVVQYLAPGGKIVIEVPNVRDVMLWRSVYRKRYFFQKAHLYYFSKKTLRRLFDKAGFIPYMSYYDFHIKGIQRYNFTTHVRWMLNMKDTGDGYYRDLMKSRLGRIYAALLVGIGRSDTLWAVLEECE